jgi:hypothetical protein
MLPVREVMNISKLRKSSFVGATIDMLNVDERCSGQSLVRGPGGLKMTGSTPTGGLGVRFRLDTIQY